MTEIGNIVTREISMVDGDLNVDDKHEDEPLRQPSLDINNAQGTLGSSAGNWLHTELVQGPFTSISSLPSVGSPLLPPNTSLPIASSTPKKLFTSRFNTSPRFGLGINSVRPPVAGFQFSSSEFFGSLNSSPVFSPSHSPGLIVIPGEGAGVEEKNFSLIEENDEERSDESISLAEAQRDAERIARLISDPAPTLSSPKSAATALPSFLRPRTQQNRSKSESLTSPSQSPTPTDRSGILSADISSLFPNLRTTAPDSEERLLKNYLDAPFSPIHRHFTRPGDSDDELSSNATESANKEAAEPVQTSITQGIRQPNDLRSPDGLCDTMSKSSSYDGSVTPEHLPPSLQSITSTRVENSKLRTQSLSPGNRFTRSSIRRSAQQQTDQSKSPSPRKLLRELSRCMSSPPNVSSVDLVSQQTVLRGSHMEDNSSPNSTRINGHARPLPGTSPYLDAAGKKERTASDVLKLLENLNASLRMTRQEVECLHSQVRYEFPESVEDEDLNKFETDTARMFRQDLEKLERMWTVDWGIHSYVQFIVRAFILAVLAVLLFFGAAYAVYLFNRALAPRPYIGPEIALGRRC
ncbi:hypothetical protein LIPSTDRAFT_106924 [Lipomyces starkeyi NRRL Y-11557]|uniref:Uncharacterized protein n=1 Tax=Lipomyces starkeyi NRRL Y-11557 TaxID=675824 RepID=A0A1E3PZY8_LIPST|nr:hypothetical protein LIPSTDRAFT_106924 [Lipomyces starkeyi NRRL Y-11557]